MIYLIITTSINNNVGLKNVEERKARYLFAIGETLQHLPSSIQPIIVENNGKRETFLDEFIYHGKKVPVVYTSNNNFSFKSKGINELMDIHEVIKTIGIQPDDMIIKLTGRYRVFSPIFFEEVINSEKQYDAFVKFFGSCSLQYELYDCILGCYAIRVSFLSMFSPLTIENYDSAEIAFARYVRFSGARVKEINHLDVECLFAEDNRILKV